MLRLLFLFCLPLSAQWGAFRNTVRVEFDPDGRKVLLLADFIYEDPTGRRWITPAGWKVDGASIPQPLWSVVGGPYEGTYREASVIHDYECDRKVSPWREVHYRFYMGMRARGVVPARAKAMYWAVYNYGPAWDSSGRDIPRSALARALLDRVFRYIEQRERGEILQPVELTDPAIRQKLETARDQVRRAKAEMISADAFARGMQAAIQSEPRNEVERLAREEMARSAEQRKAAASVSSARANAALLEAEAEAQRATGPPRPLPPMEREEIESLTAAQIPL